MYTCHNELLNYNEQIFNELYKMDTLIKMTKNMCEEKEFSGQYYGVTDDNINKLSAERNDYINMLTIASDTVSFLLKLNLDLEKFMSIDYNNTPTIAADK